MQNILVVSQDDKLKNFISQSLADYNFKSVFEAKIVQGLKLFIRNEFDIMIYDIDPQEIDLHYPLKIAKQFNRDLNLILLGEDNDFFSNSNLASTKIDYLHFKHSEFERFKYHFNYLVKDEIDNENETENLVLNHFHQMLQN